LTENKCGTCGTRLAGWNKSGFCYKHLANAQAKARKEQDRVGKTHYCQICEVALVRRHPKFDLCADCYCQLRDSNRLERLFSFQDVVHVLKEYQQGLCWFCGEKIERMRTLTGHHIYPHTMMPDSTAEENCAAAHKLCHRNFHRNVSLEEQVIKANRMPVPSDWMYK
jgi:5-methylcytosine-specific restriction endonuclease McrA